MLKYPKIQTAYLRDPDNKHKTLLEGQWATPEFELLKYIDWVATEKVNGTNIRIPVDVEANTFTIRGRTDNANTPDFLRIAIEKMFEDIRWRAFFEPDITDLALFGEGYGAKTQKGGGRYIPDGCSFILFDVNIDGVWLSRNSVDDIAGKLGINAVPVIRVGTLVDLLDASKRFDKSFVAEDKTMIPEGFVMRPATELLDRLGKRIITKIKYKDWGLK